jgi:hypothetical protein
MERVVHHLKDWKLYVWAFNLMASTLPGYAYSYFKTVIHEIECPNIQLPVLKMMNNPFHGNWILSRISTVVVTSRQSFLWAWASATRRVSFSVPRLTSLLQSLHTNIQLPVLKMMNNPFHGNWILSRISTVVVYAGDDKFWAFNLMASTLPGYAYSYFKTVILMGMGFSNTQTTSLLLSAVDGQQSPARGFDIYL